MAEARVEEDEEELKEQREAGMTHNQRRSNPDSDRSGRHKPDQHQPSPGPLSSLRAVIKRTTSTRANPHNDTPRDRRPEITILSAEPLARNSWFLGPHGGFLAAPPPAPPVWGASVPAAGQAPPSYDQVIKEKTQERVQSPDSRSRHSTSTIATQTELPSVAVTPDPESNVMSVSSPPIQLSKLRRPPRPPRPLLPTHLLPELSRATDIPATSQGETSDEHSDPDTHRVEALDCLLDFSCKPCTDATAVDTDSSELCLISLDSLLDPSRRRLSDSSADCPATEQARCPVPRPRLRQPVTKEVKVQTLVRLKDDGENAQLILRGGEDSTSKYFQELLEIFGPEERSFPSGSCEQGTESELDMSALRAKIQAFEKQNDGGSVFTEPQKPEPRPRIQQPRPPAVAPKPSLAPKPPSQKCRDDSLSAGSPAGSDSGKESPPNSGPKPPVPGASSTDVKLQDMPVSERRPSRPPVAPRSRSCTAQSKAGNTDGQAASSPDLINFDPPSSSSQPQPPGPDDKHAGSAPVRQDASRPAVPRKPSFIRIPGRPSEGESAESPPPLPAERPVSGPTHTVSQKPSAASKAQAAPRAPDIAESPGGPLTEKSAPPRPAGVKVPPPRPPTAKSVPIRPPPPKPGLCRSISEGGPNQARGQGSQRKGPALPPRPSSGPLLPGRQGKDEVLIHFEPDNAVSAECRSADSTAREPPPAMKTVAAPVAASRPGVQVPDPEHVQKARPGLQVEVLHDFSTAGPGELALKMGDVVSNVDKVDGDWYRGTCGGLSGIFPVNHVRVLSCLPAPSSGTTTKQTVATVSGPRCVARFGFEGKHSDELSLCEGDVIKLMEFVDQQWARGDLNGRVGVFPLNFVEIVEDLPGATLQPDGQTKPDTSSLLRNKDVADPNQAGPAGTEWAVALYSFTGQTDEDLPFQQGEHILITRHVDADWCCGRLNDKEGLFPKAFVQIRTG
ncbi:SH3 domain-containing protein 19-like [Brienomyrus brachyistius]|uniref:SH3 domain-containing protein 19-like n=1 Tax=Brienomyrus brachyistius TaxID=42636 RepID=UPI0020B1B125|nr:SH3 domain-containing protein 19-like [Brienomyrus brachyistius]XP_048826051.1 SH3 domain-containing protein 19-like [Brienomyrus brachyistius]XP_048826052.1 SH3 domain-containing protein 19-like [Brienomyrus brachyistius]XP_048826053.1 SH3 domain-containing protein 19-like [Brienomyrus brachyistius]XP_048826055.1 SH3 domain-containing protein 19-like [Brienomyrus brachyistius]XP_048826056.1 SH3 domain-containing protein 19-like [Brienomyrus brachyistius]XP_048826057.1 SH3 domain-containin